MRRIGILATMSGLVAILALPASAAAFDLNGCTLTLTSSDASGGHLDGASGPGSGGTADHPFQIDLKGDIHYDGTLAAQAGNYSASVAVYGLPFLTSSGDNNQAPTQSGDVNASVFPIPLVGVYPVSGTLTGQTATCSGSGYVQIVSASVLTAPQTIAAGVLLLLSIVLLLTWVRPSWAGGTK